MTITDEDRAANKVINAAVERWREAPDPDHPGWSMADAIRNALIEAGWRPQRPVTCAEVAAHLRGHVAEATEKEVAD